MSQTSNVGRNESVTGLRIRKAARELLVDQGAEAVTLRAIARSIGITAPALYRYYRSHSDLIDNLRADIGAELAQELAEDVASLPPQDGLAQFLAVCRGFRRWALAHPREFALVFATPPASTPVPMKGATEQFGAVFIATVGKVLATHEVAGFEDELVPKALRADMESFRTALLERLEAGAPELHELLSRKLTLGLSYLVVQFWSRIYGHVALEVFGHFPMVLHAPDALFDALLADISLEVGLGPV